MAVVGITARLNFMTIHCHFPRYICHLHRPKKEIKWGCDKHLPLPLPVSDGDCDLFSSSWCSAASGLLSQEGRAVPCPFLLQWPSFHRSGEPIRGLSRGPRMSILMIYSGSGRMTTWQICRPIRQVRFGSKLHLPNYHKPPLWYSTVAFSFPKKFHSST